MAKNRLCDLLNIRYPIIQAPMNWVSGADLVAAVSNAGGLGTLGPNAGAKTITSDVALTGERPRGQIRKVKTLTDKPFAVNINIGVGDARKFSQKCVEVVKEEGIAAAILSVGSPEVYCQTLKDSGIKVLAAVSTTKHAVKAEQIGVDAVICEGYEAGGHKGFTELTTFVLVPMVADKVNIPIVAGGGIADARGVLAALVLGADGVYIGTRFMVTHESDSHPTVKEAIIKAEDAATVSVPKDYMLCRDLKNQFTQKYLEMKAAGASSKILQEFLNEHSPYQAQVLGDFDGAELHSGQVAGLINSVITAAEVVQGIVNEISPKVAELHQKMSVFS
ncbi:MAG: nitronate monooxygenase [Dehalococcoidales bacterium]|nr:nitronate monooxygenase [Dehalococcoidales bacterium]